MTHKRAAISNSTISRSTSTSQFLIDPPMMRSLFLLLLCSPLTRTKPRGWCASDVDCPSTDPVAGVPPMKIAQPVTPHARSGDTASAHPTNQEGQLARATIFKHIVLPPSPNYQTPRAFPRSKSRRTKAKRNAVGGK